MNPEQVLKWLASVYQQLPVGSCDGCRDCASRCAGDVPMLSTEYQAIRQYLADEGQQIPPPPRRLSTQMMAGCRFLDRDSRWCVIYPVRPLICRLFGLVEWLPCPTGKQTMVLAEGWKLMRQYAELGPRPFTHWHEQAPQPSQMVRENTGT